MERFPDSTYVVDYWFRCRFTRGIGSESSDRSHSMYAVPLSTRNCSRKGWGRVEYQKMDRSEVVYLSARLFQLEVCTVVCFTSTTASVKKIELHHRATAVKNWKLTPPPCHHRDFKLHHRATTVTLNSTTVPPPWPWTPPPCHHRKNVLIHQHKIRTQMSKYICLAKS